MFVKDYGNVPPRSNFNKNIVLMDPGLRIYADPIKINFYERF